MRLLLLVMTGVLIGCGGPGEEAAAGPQGPQSFDGAECGVCGMTVADQPSPRGQVAHRDGEHVFFCSLGDLAVSLDAPGPRGTPEALWVEVLPAGLDPADHDTAPQAWVLADEAVYQFGPARRVLGRPVLSFAQGEGMRWNELRDQLRQGGTR